MGKIIINKTLLIKVGKGLIALAGAVSTVNDFVSGHQQAKKFKEMSDNYDALKKAFDAMNK